MKKFITIILALGLLHTGASAQWYLYPGGRNEEKQEQTEAERQTQPQKQTRPERRQTRQEQAPEESVREPLRQLPESRIGTEGRNSWFAEPLFGRQSEVSVTLALPIGAGSEKPNANFLEMYSGALLALKDLGDEGVKVKLKLVDTASGAGLSPEDINGSDLVIGPVSYNEMLTALTLCDNGKVLVSPLDPKTAKLAETSGIIQAPASWTSQIDELVEWVQEDLRPEDQLIVVADPDSAGRGEQYRYLLDRLHGKVLDFRTVSSVNAINFIEGRTYRMLIASDSDSFLTGTARAAAIEAARNRDIILYSTSRIRSTIGSNVNDLHNTRTRLTAAYYIDYGSRKVKDFILSYRALFKGEPGSFAFQGYDTMHYFVKACHDYGRNWARRLPEFPEKGLQSDFSFNRRQGDGKLNVAVRRVVYNSDLTTSLVQD